MAELETISQMLKEIQAAYPNWKADANSVKIWAVYLADMDDELLVTAIRKFISSADHAFPPSIPEIRKSAAELVRQIQGVPSAYEAWEDLQAAGRGTRKKVMENNEIVTIEYMWAHPLVKVVAARLGWPDRFPGSVEQEMADRSHYIRAYEQAIAEASTQQTQLPQITNYIASTQMKQLAEGMKK